MEEQGRRRARRGETRGGVSLPAVQSIIGGIVVLLVLVLRLVGGGIYDQLREAFRTAITDDSLAQTIADALDEDGAADSATP